MQALFTKTDRVGVLPNASTNGGDASRVGKDAATYFSRVCIYAFLYSRRGTRLLKKPRRDASPPLVLAFGACIIYQIDRLKSKFEAMVAFDALANLPVNLLICQPVC